MHGNPVFASGGLTAIEGFESRLARLVPRRPITVSALLKRKDGRS
jgi:hypothetical protein